MNTFTLARSSLRAVARQQQSSRGLAISAVRSSNGHNVDPENAAKDLEDGKHKSVNGIQDNTVKHAPGWNEKIASESEAIVKGLKEDRNPQELAKETVERLTEQNKKESSS